jgi:Ca-activated chloride channel family protein
MSTAPLLFTITPHRELFPANSTEQKLFLMLKLQPSREVAASRPSTTFAFLIDTSGSMFEVVSGDSQLTGEQAMVDGNLYNLVSGGKTKIDIVIESLQGLIHSGKLNQSDRVSIIQFDDTASTLIGLTPATQTSQIEAAIDRLKEFSGGTSISLGLRQALNSLSGQTMTNRRALIFTDGQTSDEFECEELAKQFAQVGIPITALGIGDYNEDLLLTLTDTTGGMPYHVVPGAASGSQVTIDQLPDKLIGEFGEAQQEVITNLKMSLSTVKGVKLSRIIRVYPTNTEFPVTQAPYPVGNVAGDDETIFVLEFAIETRVPGRVRIAQLSLTYDIPGMNRRGEISPQNLLVEFVAGQIAAQVDQEVMGYVQQANISQLVDQASKVADQNPDQANELLEKARRMTVKLGNTAMTESLEGAQDELRKTRKLSPDSRKTVKMGSKGKTVKMNDGPSDGLTEEQIRKMSGT